MEEIRYVAAIGKIGAGVHEPSLLKALALEPHFIASDAGSTDSGPFSLGSGQCAFSREAVARDMEVVIGAAKQAGIPMIVGTAGTAGADAQVDWLRDIVVEIADRRGWRLRVALIRAEQDKQYVRELHAHGRIFPLEPAPHIDRAVIDRSTRIVGMMGAEPLQDALRAGVDLIIAGRCSDAALFAALPLMRGFPAGLAWHAAKVVQCGTEACETLGPGVIVGIVRHHEAIIMPVGDGLRCTPGSIAAHSMYEDADPFLHKECSGTLDMTKSQFEAAGEVSVRITGSTFEPAAQYTVKLEGVELVGYQSIIVGGVRDPFIIMQIDDWLARISAYVHDQLAELLRGRVRREDYSLVFHVYGHNAVMGALEPEMAALSHEVGIVLEATASTQALATTIAKACRQPLLHAPIPQWKGSITGFVCLHNPAEIERGPVWRFNLNHVAAPLAYADMFRTELVEIGEGT